MADDALEGDPTLFARKDGVEEDWRIVAELLDGAAPPDVYAPGTWGPAAADRVAADTGGWITPG